VAGAVSAKNLPTQKLRKRIMALLAKAPFAGLFRGWFRPAEKKPTVAPPARPPAAALAPARTLPTPPVAGPVASDNGSIEIPIAPILAGLPMELRAKMMSAPPAGATITLSTELVASQLGFGSVKISFGELRQLAPGIFAPHGAENDSRPVNLPLQEILARIHPAQLARSHTRKDPRPSLFRAASMPRWNCRRSAPSRLRAMAMETDTIITMAKPRRHRRE
jgi:hypothetical protein